MVTVDELAQRFRQFADTTARSGAPLYARLSASIADDGDLLALLGHAPETQQLPVLLLAGVHAMLLGDRADPLASRLAAHYPNLARSGDVADGDPAQLFREFALDRADELAALISACGTQTNEVGRCAQFLPLLGLLDDELRTSDEPARLAHVDVGTSAGLTLLLPRYGYEYAPGGRVGGPAPVELRCSTVGPLPVPTNMPSITCSIGLDRAPINVLDDAEVRWLEACVWPDHADRFARLVAAIGMAREQPPDVRRGDAVEGLDKVVGDAAAHGHPVVTNSWVLNYLTDDARRAYVAELDRLGNEGDLSWIIAEAPAQTPGLPVVAAAPDEELTVLSLVRWRDGVRTTARLGTTHPHGYWINWGG